MPGSYLQYCFSLIFLLIVLVTGCGPEQNLSPEKQQEIQHILDLSREAFHRQNLQHALHLADSASAAHPGYIETWFVKGLIYDRMDSLQRAEKYYRSVLRRDNRFPGIQFNVANTYFRQKQYEDAITHYKTALSQYRPGEVPFQKPDIYVNLGLTYSRLGESDSAKMNYQQAIATDSAYGDAYLLMAKELQQDGNFAEAKSYLNQVVLQYPDNLNYRYDLAAIQFQSGEIDRAAEHLEYIITNRPWDYRAHYTLGQVLLRKGAEVQAGAHIALSDSLRSRLSDIFALQQEAMDKPNNLMLWANLARGLYDIGNIPEALRAMERALALDQDNVAIQNNMAYMQLSAGDTLAAIRRFETILEQDSSQVDVWANLALTLSNSGRTEQAKQAWQQVLELDPDNNAAQRHLP